MGEFINRPFFIHLSLFFLRLFPFRFFLPFHFLALKFPSYDPTSSPFPFFCCERWCSEIYYWVSPGFSPMLPLRYFLTLLPQWLFFSVLSLSPADPPLPHSIPDFRLSSDLQFLLLTSFFGCVLLPVLIPEPCFYFRNLFSLSPRRFNCWLTTVTVLDARFFLSFLSLFPWTHGAAFFFRLPSEMLFEWALSICRRFMNLHFSSLLWLFSFLFFFSASPSP